MDEQTNNNTRNLQGVNTSSQDNPSFSTDSKNQESPSMSFGASYRAETPASQELGKASEYSVATAEAPNQAHQTESLSTQDSDSASHDAQGAQTDTTEQADQAGTEYGERNAQATSRPPQHPLEPRSAYPAQSAQSAAKKSDKKTSNRKTFLFAFLGAALACVLALGGYSIWNNTGSVTLGASGEGTTITVQGEDATLAETVANKALPSVVNINVYTMAQTQMWPVTNNSTELTESSLGSGVILSADGYILTNYHVIEGADSLVVVANGDEYEAQVVGSDSSSDLAVLKIDATGLTPIEIGSSSDLVVGEWVMAVGSPFGLEQSVSTGIVSATSRSTTSLNSSSSTAIYTNMIQTDAAINPGNSGGALVDKDGKLIGINTIIASTSGSSSGVGFAIPVDYAMGIAQQIINGEEPSHAQLGVSLMSVNSSMAQRYGLPVESGAYVIQVSPGSGAEAAGIQEGDIIVAIDDTKVTSSSELIVDVRSHNIGDTVNITINRNGQEQTLQVQLGSDA